MSALPLRLHDHPCATTSTAMASASIPSANATAITRSRTLLPLERDRRLSLRWAWSTLCNNLCAMSAASPAGDTVAHPCSVCRAARWFTRARHESGQRRDQSSADRLTRSALATSAAFHLVCSALRGMLIGSHTLPVVAPVIGPVIAAPVSRRPRVAMKLILVPAMRIPFVIAPLSIEVRPLLVKEPISRRLIWARISMLISGPLLMIAPPSSSIAVYPLVSMRRHWERQRQSRRRCYGQQLRWPRHLATLALAQ